MVILQGKASSPPWFVPPLGLEENFGDK